MTPSGVNAKGIELTPPSMVTTQPSQDSSVRFRTRMPRAPLRTATVNESATAGDECTAIRAIWRTPTTSNTQTANRPTAATDRFNRSERNTSGITVPSFPPFTSEASPNREG